MKEEIEKLGKILANVTQENKNEDKIGYDPISDIEMGEGWNQPG